jgi:hypothetical protein
MWPAASVSVTDPYATMIFSAVALHCMRIFDAAW